MNSFETISSAIREGTKMLSHEDAFTFEIGRSIIKVMVLNKGDQVVTHAHEYTHAHILGKGKIMLEVSGLQTIYSAPSAIEIKAGEHHGITALEDSFGFCVHDRDELGWVPFKGN